MHASQYRTLPFLLSVWMGRSVANSSRKDRLSTCKKGEGRRVEEGGEGGDSREGDVGERGNGKREKGKGKEMKKRGPSLCCSVCERHIRCDLRTISSMVSICSSVKRNWKETKNGCTAS